MTYTIHLRPRMRAGSGLYLEGYEANGKELFLFWSSLKNARQFATEREARAFVARIRMHYPSHEGRLVIHRRDS